MRFPGPSGCRDFFHAHRRGLAGAATLLLIVGACLLVYSIPWRMDSWDDLPNVMGMGDHWDYYLPNAYYMDVALHDFGEFPLWTPLTFCGMPFAANPQTIAFYPPNLLRSVLTFEPTPFRSNTSLVLMLALHVLLAGYGTYLLAREHGLTYGASLVCVFAFLFSAGVVRRTVAGVYLTTVAWAPLALYLMTRSMRGSTRAVRVWYAVATGLVLGVGFLSKVSQMGVYLALTIALYAVLERMTLLDLKSFRSYRKLIPVFLFDVFTGVVIISVAVLVAACLFLPGAELAHASGRGGEPDPTSMPWSFLSSSAGLAWLSKIFVLFTAEKNQYSHYKLAGLGTTLLALAALYHPQKRHVVKFGILFLFFVDCSMGPPLPGSRICLWLAPFSFGNLGRAMMWSCFPLAMLAGYGADAAALRWERRHMNPLYSICLLLVGGAALVWLWRMVHPHDLLDVGSEVVVFPFLLLVVAVFSGAISKVVPRQGGFWRTAPGRLVQHRGFVAVLLAVLLLSELVCWNWRYVPHLLEWRGFDGDVPALQHKQQFWENNKRGLEASLNTHVLRLEPAINGYEPLYIEDVHNVICRPNVYEKILLPTRPGVLYNPMSALLLKRAFWLAPEYAVGPLPPNDVLFPPTTTVYLQEEPEMSGLSFRNAAAIPNSGVSRDSETIEILSGPQAEQRTAHKEGGQIVLEIPSVALPPRHSVLQVVYQADSEAELTTWLSEGTGETALGLYKKFRIVASEVGEKTIEIPLPDCDAVSIRMHAAPRREDGRFRFGRITLVSDMSEQNNRIQIVKRTPNSAEVRVVDLPQTGLLVYLDAHYPGWKAFIDGEETSIYRADEAFKAVVVPKGTHTVRFEFVSTSAYVGAGISTLTVLLALPGLFFTRKLARGKAIDDGVVAKPSA